MDNGQSERQTTLPGKKELKKQLADKLENTLPELREMLGEKKFIHRVKKAAKLLMEGLHKKDKFGKKQPSTEDTAVKKHNVKKITTKKAAAKKGAAKKAKATPVAKAKSTNKKSSRQ